jgi:hypothetical protein
MTEAEKQAKKRLAFGDDTDTDLGKLTDMNAAMVVDGTLSNMENVNKRGDENTKKRHKITDGTSVSTDTGSAASFEDDRRAQ